MMVRMCAVSAAAAVVVLGAAGVASADGPGDGDVFPDFQSCSAQAHRVEAEATDSDRYVATCTGQGSTSGLYQLTVTDMGASNGGDDNGPQVPTFKQGVHQLFSGSAGG